MSIRQRVSFVPLGAAAFVVLYSRPTKLQPE